MAGRVTSCRVRDGDDIARPNRRNLDDAVEAAPGGDRIVVLARLWPALAEPNVDVVHGVAKTLLEQMACKRAADAAVAPPPAARGVAPFDVRGAGTVDVVFRRQFGDQALRPNEQLVPHRCGPRGRGGCHTTERREGEKRAAVHP